MCESESQIPSLKKPSQSGPTHLDVKAHCNPAMKKPVECSQSNERTMLEGERSDAKKTQYQKNETSEAAEYLDKPRKEFDKPH